MKTILAFCVLAGAGLVAFNEINHPPGTRAAEEESPKASGPAVWMMGHVRQVLADGLIVFDLQSNRLVFLSGYPNERSVADRDSVRCYGVRNGVKRYVTVLGAGATIPRYQWTPAPATPIPKPGDWMFQGGGTALDRR